MKKLILLLSILILPTEALAQCLPEPDLPPIISISEVDFHNPEQDFIEIFISHPDYINPQDIQVLIDQKNIFPTETTLQKFTYIPTNLTSTTEQIILTYKGKTLDGLCWQNQTPSQSESEDLTNYQQQNLTPCFNSDTIPKQLHLSRTNLYPTYLQTDWQLTPHLTPSQENNFQSQAPQAKIEIQSGQTQSTNPINLNLDGSQSNDPFDLDLSYHWDFGNQQTSNKANPPTISYSSPGIYTIQLTVTNSLGLSHTTFLSINYFQLPAPEDTNSEATTTNSQEETTSTSNNPTNSEDNQQIQATKNYHNTSIQITAFLANPEGTDTNNEWVEITNTGQTEINISNWQIDDQIGQSNPYQIPDNTTIPAQSSLKIYNHQSKINLNNTEDSVRLITPDNQTFSSYPYQNALSGQIIYTNQSPVTPQTESTSQDETTTDSTKEITQQTYPSLHITEIFPNPSGADTGNEWIEIYNPNQTSSPTTNWQLQVNNKTIKLPDQDLAPNSYTQIQLNGLTNSETNLQLLDPNNTSHSSVSYSKSTENQSYQQTNSDWIWSEHLTPNQPNIQIITSKTSITAIDEILQTITIQDQTIISYNKQEIPPINTEVELSFIQSTNSNQLIEISPLNQNHTASTTNNSPLSSLNYQTSQTSSSGIPWQAQLATYSAISIAGITFRKPISQFIKTKITV